MYKYIITAKIKHAYIMYSLDYTKKKKIYLACLFNSSSVSVLNKNQKQLFKL